MIIGLSVTLLFIHIFNVMDTCERISVWNITYNFHLPAFLPASFLCLSFPSSFFFFFFFFFFLIYYPELCDCFLSNSGNALCSGPCFSHSLLLGWFILAVALTLVHSFSLSCNIPQCDYFSVISPSSSIWVISSFVVMNYSFMIFHLCESCRLWSRRPLEYYLGQEMLD